MSNFCPATRGTVVFAFFSFSFFFLGSLFSRALGREELCEQISRACAHSDSATLGLPPLTAYVLSQSTLLRLQVALPEPSDAGPSLHALPRSKPLRFRLWGTPQRRRLGWACVLRPSQARAAQVTRCLACVFAPSWRLRLPPSPIPAARFSGCTRSAPSWCAVCLFWGAGFWLRPSRQMSIIQSPKKSWLAEKSACSLV